MFKWLRNILKFRSAEKRRKATDAALDRAYQKEIDKRNRIIREITKEAREEDGIEPKAPRGKLRSTRRPGTTTNPLKTSDVHYWDDSALSSSSFGKGCEPGSTSGDSYSSSDSGGSSCD